MRKSDIFPSKYLKGEDIEGREITAVIAECKMEDVGGEEDKLVIRFQNATKGLVCNVTNFDRIAYINGSDDTSDWPGTEVVLYTELATFQGRTRPAPRIKAPLKKQNGAKPVSSVSKNQGLANTTYVAQPPPDHDPADDMDFPDDKSVPF